MNRQARSCDGAGDGDWPQGRYWACPFYSSNPIRHATCLAYKLGRVADVRQHIERKHAEEAGEGEIEKMKSKNDRGTTNVERWYALWILFFPGQARPATPYYTGTEFVDLSVAFASRFMEEWEKNGTAGDAKRVVAGYLAFVKTTYFEIKSGRMSIQAVADVSEHHPPGSKIQDSISQSTNTYQHLPLLADLPCSILVGQPRQTDRYHNTQAPNVPTQTQTPWMPVTNSQYWRRPADAEVFPTVSTQQVPSVQSLYVAPANGLVDFAIDGSNRSGAMDWASSGAFGPGGDDEHFGLEYYN